MRKTIIFAITVCALLAIYAYIVWPWNVDQRVYSKPAWWQKSRFNFSTFEIPKEYEYKFYCEGHLEPLSNHYLILLKKLSSDEQIIIFRPHGFISTKIQKIQIYNKITPNPLIPETHHITDTFNIIYHLPLIQFLRRDDLADKYSNLTLVGIQAEATEKYETDFAKVLSVKGRFERVGFYKHLPFPWGFSNFIFDFFKEREGALAILESKDKNETLFVFGLSGKKQAFDEATFKKFIHTVSFKKTPYRPALLEGPDATQETKVSFVPK